MEIHTLGSTPDLLGFRGKNNSLIVLQDYKYDEGALRVAGEKKSQIILVPVGQLITAKGMARARLLSKFRNFLKLCIRYGVLYAIGIVDKSIEREDNELIAIGILLGLARGQAKMAVARFKDIAK
jgi:RNase P/RNase MRP subunit p30